MVYEFKFTLDLPTELARDHVKAITDGAIVAQCNQLDGKVVDGVEVNEKETDD